MCRVLLEAGDGTPIERGESVMWGVSPFNSFYSSATIRCLIHWSVPRFDRVYVLLAGPEAARRFISAGMAPRKAVAKVMTQVHQQRRAAQRAIRTAGYAHSDRDVIVWSRLAGNARYLELRSLIRQAYETEPNVREVVRATTELALAAAAGGRSAAEVVDANVDYVFAETPVVLDAAAMLSHDHTVFAYHRRFPLFDYLATGAVPALAPGPGQVYAQLTLTPEAPHAVPCEPLGHRLPPPDR